MKSFGIGFTGDLPVKETVRLTQMAEKKGFDRVWMADESPSYPFRDAFVNMTAIALNTKKIKIGSAVFVPYSRHPAILSVFAATLSELAPGRVALGIGRGGSLVLRPLGIKMWDKPLATLRETMIVTRRLLAGETVDFEGEAIKVKNVKLAQPPKNKVPIYLAARGQKTLQMVGELADGPVLSCPARAPALKFSLEHIGNGAKMSKRTLNDLDIVNYLPFAVAKDREKALEKVKLVVTFVASDTPDEVHEKIGTNMVKLNAMRQTLKEKGLMDAMKLLPNEIAQDFSIAGTVDDCIDRIKENFKNGVNQVAVEVMGDTKEAFEILGKDIIPKFK